MVLLFGIEGALPGLDIARVWLWRVTVFLHWWFREWLSGSDCDEPKAHVVNDPNLAGFLESRLELGSHLVEQRRTVCRNYCSEKWLRE